MERFLTIIDGKQVEVMAYDANEAIEKAKTIVKSDTAKNKK